MMHEKVPSNKDLLTAIRQNWNLFDKEHCFKLVKSMPERVQAVIDAQGRAKYKF